MAVLAALWALLLKPQIESTAKDAVKNPIAQQAKQIAAVNKAAQTAQVQAAGAAAEAAQASTQAQQAQTTAQQASTTAGGASTQAKSADKNAANASSTASTAQGAVQSVTTNGPPINGRLQVNCPPTCSASLAVPADATAISVTDLILQNPGGDSGKLTLKRGQDIVLTEQLDNFRDLDFHFIAPLVVSTGQTLVLNVQCTNGQGQQAAAAAATPTGPCTPAVYYAGFKTEKTPKKP